MSMNTATSGTILDFSLARGDPLFRLQQKLGLVPPGGQGLVRRAVFWSMLGWLPIAAWAFFVNRALPGEVQEPLLAHFGVHARLLVAVPLLIIFKTVFAAAGTPDIAGFLFEDGTLTHVGEDEEKDA